MGEGEGRTIWGNGIETCIISNIVQLLKTRDILVVFHLDLHFPNDYL